MAWKCSPLIITTETVAPKKSSVYGLLVFRHSVKLWDAEQAHADHEPRILGFVLAKAIVAMMVAPGAK